MGPNYSKAVVPGGPAKLALCSLLSSLPPQEEGKAPTLLQSRAGVAYRHIGLIKFPVAGSGDTARSRQTQVLLL